MHPTSSTTYCHIPFYHGIPPWTLDTSNHQVIESVTSLSSVTALIVDIVVVAVVKAITRRRRPVANKEDEMFAPVMVDKYSFPSGHSTRAVMLSLLLPMQVSLGLCLSSRMVLCLLRTHCTYGLMYVLLYLILSQM